MTAEEIMATMKRYEPLLRKNLRVEQRYRLNGSVENVTSAIACAFMIETERRGRELILDAPTISEIESSARWLVNGNKFGLLLYGTIGSGKTTLARSIADVITSDTGDYVKKLSAIDLADIKSGSRNDFNDAKTCRFLVIDDVGLEPFTVSDYGTHRTPFVELISARYNECLLTIMTSNLDDKDILERYGDRTEDRIREMFDTIAFTQPSYR